MDQLHAVHDVLAAGWERDEEREDIVTRYMGMVWFVIELLAGRYR